MQFNGTEEIAASRAKVWRFLMDPQQVGSCGPGVQSIEVVDADHFNARAKVGVGFITVVPPHQERFDQLLKRLKQEFRG